MKSRLRVVGSVSRSYVSNRRKLSPLHHGGEVIAPVIDFVEVSCCFFQRLRVDREVFTILVGPSRACL